jgi:hypothetical protein
MYDKHQIREKPDMVKVTSPVLKSSGERRLSPLRQQLATDQGFFCLFLCLVNFLNIKAIHERTSIFTTNVVIPARDAGIQELYQVSEYKSYVKIHHLWKTGSQCQALG